jgi:hypothetical protein
MPNKKLGLFNISLIFYSVIVGALTGVLELFIGHRFILDPLLYDKDPGFVYESYFAPTYYGFTKSIVVAIVFFLVYLLTSGIKMRPLLKASIIGILGTVFFGIYYYFTFPHVTLYGDAVIGIVHFLFIAGVSYGFIKLFHLK